VAVQLASGDWIGSDVFYQAPLYPYFLGASTRSSDATCCGPRHPGARRIGVVRAARLACKRLFSKRVGLVAGLALALWAPAIFFDSLLQKAVLDMFFMCLSLWLIAGIMTAPPKGGRSLRVEWPPALAGIVLGLLHGGPLGSSRENGLLLVGSWRSACYRTFYGRSTDVLRTSAPPIVERPQNVRRTSVEPLLWFVAGLAIVFAPVVARNYSVDGGFYLTTSQFGSNFYIGNNPNADGTYASIRFGRGAPEFERLDAKEVAEESVGHALSPSEVSSFWADAPSTTSPRSRCRG
jgi:hypothetical protein